MPSRLHRVRFADDCLADQVVLATTTRYGGISAAPFAELNCSYSGGDDPARVSENRRRALADLGLDADALVIGGQVHETRVAVVRAGDRGRGARGPDTVLPRTDGLLTDVPGLPLGATTADCVPVFLCAPDARVVGLLHAGWRGTVRGILGTALTQLAAEWAVPASGVHVAFGPAIGGCCYEVGEDVASHVVGAGVPPEVLRATGPGAWHFDLRAHLLEQCAAAGVPRHQIGIGGPCTRCESETFFSYRAEGPRSGRLLSVIAWRDTA